MIVNADAKALEWFGAVYLSKDKKGYEEIWNEVDQHTMNQNDFGLPSRLIAKKFVFRLIYGGSAYSYANDNDFVDVSRSEEFWQDVIDKFYKKYSGIKIWHEALMLEAMSSGRVCIPTGRHFPFRPVDGKKGPKWPRTQILNYPVQGFGADLMVLARYILKRELFGKSGVKFICTVHDSIVWDVVDSEVDSVVETIFKSWESIPQEFQKWFGVPLDLPPKVEVGVGPNWKDLKEIKNGV
jgi:DNA polymerase I-like protein with 3'-5' exonuclease and polymerase domains